MTPDPYRSSATLAPDQDVAPGRGVFIACTAAGMIRLRWATNGYLDVPVAIGPNVFDNVAIRGFASTGTTAAGTVSVLY